MFCLCRRPVTAHGYSRCPLWQPCAATGRCHYSIVRTMTPWNHAPRVSFVCSKRGCLQLFAFCLHCCNVLQHLSKFVAVIAVTARLKLFGKAEYIFGVAERVLGAGEPPRSWLFECGFLAAAGRLTFVAGIRQRRCGLGYMDRGGYYPYRGPCKWVWAVN